MQWKRKKLPVSPLSGLVDKDDFSGIPFNEYKKHILNSFF